MKKLGVILPRLAPTLGACMLSIALAGCSNGGSGSNKKTTTSSGLLRYAPPPLTNPVTLALGTGVTISTLDDSKDYFVQLPATKKMGATVLIGGHNVVILGGAITIPSGYVGPSQTLDASSMPNNPQYQGVYVGAAIYIKDNVGTVHIEGVSIDDSGGEMEDGIDVSAPQSTVQIENVRVDGIYGYTDEFHADVIQTFGGVKDLRVDELTGYTGYQGLSIGPVTASPSDQTAEVSRMNLVTIDAQIDGTHSSGGYVVWLTGNTSCTGQYPMTFTDLYAQPRSGETLANAIWPPPGSTATSCPSSLSADGSTVTFPSIPVTGSAQLGPPPDGDYVPASTVGLDYVSPGYQ